MAEVIVVGAGFAGLWAALGAARRLDELAVAAGTVTVTVLSTTAFHDIRVRNYEADLRDCRIPLAGLFGPAGVAHRTAQVTAIDTAAQRIDTADGTSYRYDRLVLASGSRVAKPDVPGLRMFGFDVDTYDAAIALDDHLRALAHGPATAAAATAVVIGAGLTGIETACELPARLAATFAGRGVTPRVILVDRSPQIGSDMGPSARPVIAAALSDNNVETRVDADVVAVGPHSVSLADEVLAAHTVVWCAGMAASPLTAQLPVALDRLGRVAVDAQLRVVGVPSVFAAGDVAAAPVDGAHRSVMSCQHSRPMGRYAGYNVVADLLGGPLLTLRIPWYVTVVDLGPAGAVYTGGWDRQVLGRGASAKATKQAINTARIYPPRTGDRAALLAAAAPAPQERPVLGE